MQATSLQPVPRQSVPEAVAAQLEQQILHGHLAVGTDLPGERALAEALGVSRPTVREALRRLQQQGLVDIRQGGATTVRDFRRTAGLDLLPRLLREGGRVDLDLVADVMQARTAIGPHVARAAADNAADDPAGAAAVSAAAEQVAAAVRQDATAASPDPDAAAPPHPNGTAAPDADPVAAQRAALACWDAIVDLTGSMVYRLLYNGLRRAYEPALEALAPVLAVEVGDGSRHLALARAIAAADPDAAEHAAAHLLDAGRRAVVAAIDHARCAALHAVDTQEPTA